MTDRDPARSRWTVLTDPAVDDVLLGMVKAGVEGEALSRVTLRFLRALALEAGAAHEAGRKLPGMRLSDGRQSVVVPRESILVYYVALTEHHELRVTDLIWMV
ncbi:propanediol dehydratase small subunit [Streptacidiphilus sp. MAP12-20]|uniref:hypothetical protein n=1 Tax=Streptacidiphilus sp. MAP12-20 TaxID=3156299 RepID=UPI003514CD66